MRPDPAEVVIGRLGRPHGVDGRMRARATGPTLATLRPGERVRVRRAPGEPPRELELGGVRAAGTGVIVGFRGIDTREAASALAGADLLVAPARLPAPSDPDEVYVRDLIGCVVRVAGRDLGPITDVHAAPANDALELRGPQGPLLVPFTHDAVVGLDLAARVIELREGLLDPEAYG